MEVEEEEERARELSRRGTYHIDGVDVVLTDGKLVIR